MLYENEEQIDAAEDLFMDQVWESKYEELDPLDEEDDEQ